MLFKKEFVVTQIIQSFGFRQLFKVWLEYQKIYILKTRKKMIMVVRGFSENRMWDGPEDWWRSQPSNRLCERRSCVCRCFWYV